MDTPTLVLFIIVIIVNTAFYTYLLNQINELKEVINNYINKKTK